MHNKVAELISSFPRNSNLVPKEQIFGKEKSDSDKLGEPPSPPVPSPQPTPSSIIPSNTPSSSKGAPFGSPSKKDLAGSSKSSYRLILENGKRKKPTLKFLSGYSNDNPFL